MAHGDLPSADIPLAGEHATLADAFEAAAEQFAEREAYVEAGRRLSFGAWHRAADRLAHALVAQGVQPGGVVLLHLPSSIDYAICYGAIALAGAVATGVNLRLGPREIAAIIDTCAPSLIISHDPQALPAGAARARIMSLEAVRRHSAEGRPLGHRRPQRDAADPVTIIWTSGTTGTPKGAWFDHRNLQAAVRTAGVMTRAFDRKLPSTPFPHAGYMAKLWEQLAFGVTQVVAAAPWRASDMLRQMRDERVTSGAGVPTQWMKLMELPELDSTPLPQLRLCVTATAPAPPELVEQVTRRLGCPMISRYAMTESPSISGTAPGDDPQVLYRTVGKPQEGIQVSIVDEAGRSLPRGQVGRLRIKGPCVMRGYWNAPELTRGVLDADGWLTSGDLGYVDPGGNLVLAGRASDMYIRGGYNVYPLEVENVLLEHPAVAQASVVGLETPVIGEIGVAFVVPADPQAPPSLDELRAWCRERLADYKAPDRLELVDRLPLTAMLKVDKSALRARLRP